MATNDNDKLVIAYYVNAAAAEAAGNDLKDWDKENDDVKLGAIGVITIDENNGEIHVKEIGARKTKKGALWGTAIGAGLGILTAGIALIPGLIAGAAIGGGIGALDHKSLGMTDEDVHDLAEHLKHGGAALGVMCDDFEVAATQAKMYQEGGKTELFNIDDKTATQIYSIANAQADASAAVDEAVAEEADPVAAIAVASGVAASDASKLHEAGIDKASALLEQGATPQGRAELSEATGLDDETILTAVKKMDLMRVKGVSVVYAELLHSSGVETVPDLARRNPANLTAKMAEVNETADIAETVPSEEMVADWVSQAKDLPRVIEY